MLKHNLRGNLRSSRRSTALVLWFAVESFLYIRHVKRMKRIWDLLEKLDLKLKE